MPKELIFLTFPKLYTHQVLQTKQYITTAPMSKDLLIFLDSLQKAESTNH